MPNLISYSAAVLRGMRKQPVYEPAAALCKQLGIFRFRGCKGGKRRITHKSPGTNRDPPKATTVTIPPKEINLLLMNARSIVNKLPELDVVLRKEKASIAVVTETWLKPDVQDSMVCPPGFNITRADRETKKKGGGVAIFTSSEWSTTTLSCHLDHPPGVECVVSLIRLMWMPRTITGLIVYGIYAPPMPKRADVAATTDHIVASIDRIGANYPGAKIILAGDFNSINLGTLHQLTNLSQIVKNPTRKEALLDQIFTNLPPVSVTHLHPLGASDHCIIKSTHVLSNIRDTEPCSELWVRPKPPDALRRCGLHLATTDWSFVINAPDVDTMYGRFEDFMMDTLQEFFPRKRIKRDNASREWFTDEIKILIKRRNVHYRKNNLTLCKKLSNQIRSAISKAKKNFYKKRIKTFKKLDPRKWHSEVRKFGGMAEKAHQECVFDPEVLNSHFIGAGGGRVHDLDHLAPSGTRSTPPEDITSATKSELWEHETALMLQRIDSHKAQPRDDIPAWLLKEFFVECAKPVTAIFNASLSSASIPSKLSTIEILPIPKVSNPKAPGDFRPIAKLKILLKVLEKFVATIFRAALTRVVDKKHYGGLPKRSTTHYLVELLHFVHMNLDRGDAVGIACLDFAKAFDSIVHQILISQLPTLQLKKIVTNWIIAFMTSLSQVVRAPGHLASSKPQKIVRGIPQGSSLGPSLFTFAVNNIPVGEDGWLFLDDTTTGEVDHLIAEVVGKLETAVGTLSAWADVNHLRLNPTKSVALIFSFGRQAGDKPNVLSPAGGNIQIVPHTKLLGIIIQEDLKWDLHVKAILTKTRQKMFFLRTLSNYGMPMIDLALAYKTYVRPVMEYACPVWHSSITARHSQSLESQQKRALMLVTREWRNTYEENLERTGIQRLDARREDLCAAFAYNLAKSEEFSKSFPPKQSTISSRSTRHSDNYAVIGYKTSRMQKSPYPYFSRLLNERQLVV